MKFNKKLKTGLVGLMMLGSTGLAGAQTIDVGNSKINYSINSNSTYCLDSIQIFDEEHKSLALSKYSNCGDQVVGVYESGKLTPKNAENYWVYKAASKNGFEVKKYLENIWLEKSIKDKTKKMEEIGKEFSEISKHNLDSDLVGLKYFYDSLYN